MFDPLIRPSWWDPKQSIANALCALLPSHFGAKGESYTTIVDFFKQCDSGLLTSCSHEISDQGFEAFKFSEGSEIMCNKGFLWTTCKGVTFINTHMQASDDPLIPLGYGVPNAHAKQLEQLGRFIQKHREAGQHAIV